MNHLTFNFYHNHYQHLQSIVIVIRGLTQHIGSEHPDLPVFVVRLVREVVGDPVCLLREEHLVSYSPGSSTWRDKEQ